MMARVAMLVEDTVLHQKLFTIWLNSCGYDVHVVADERLAVVKAATLQPDVIVIDILLPHVDGRDVIRSLRRDQNTRHVPIVALSVLSGVEDEESCYTAGANAFLPKLIGLASFAACMKQF